MIVTAILALMVLASLGAQGLLLLLPSVSLGALAGGSVYYRGYVTGAMIEEDEEE